MEQQQEKFEYLSEWPPIESSTDKKTVPDNDLPPPKRHKHDCGTRIEASNSTIIGMSHVKSRLHFNMGMGPVEKEELQQSVEEISLVRSAPSLQADSLLARWWKFHTKISNQDCMQKMELSGNTVHRVRFSNPQTQLFHITRLSDAQNILKYRIRYLESRLSSQEIFTATQLAEIHACLSTCYMRLSITDNKNLSSALNHSHKATELEASNFDMKWITELLLRQQNVEQLKHKAESRLERTRLTLEEQCLFMPKSVQVERKSVRELSYKQFYEEYAQTHTPLIITGVVEHMTATPWTLDYIKQAIGDKIAPLKQMINGSVCWASLESAQECRVSDFIDSLESYKEQRYLFDWSLPINCPKLAKELRIPKYFANDFLQQTPIGSLYQDSWPSLFVAPSGVSSELHVDAFGSNFWMALFQGRKRWVFFPPDDIPLLYPLYNHSTDAMFEVNLANPDLCNYPLLSLTHPRECILQPGELLFVPAGCPHRVENVEKSLAISANFVDSSNVELVKKELQVNALLDERAAQLLKVFESNRFTTKAGFNFGDDSICVSWEHFKSHSHT